MTDTNELKAEMARYGDTGLTLANALGITNATMSKKLNNLAEFSQKEISIIKDRYRLQSDKIEIIFFAHQVP